jgi:hypothetical protein
VVAAAGRTHKLAGQSPGPAKEGIITLEGRDKRMDGWMDKNGDMNLLLKIVYVIAQL